MQYSDSVILVDTYDQVIGTEEKLKAHELGLLHRAISVFVYNSKGEMLLQKRANNKYHSGGLWTNSCCSHPMPGESTEDAARRRLKEEMGMRISDLNFVFSFLYKAELNNKLIEHELDHVFFGISDELPLLNIEEASDFKYVKVEKVLEEIKAYPDHYTFWFKHILERAIIEAKKLDYC
jgi:isopentenyl-diphosphate Delta-isomerase